MSLVHIYTGIVISGCVVGGTYGLVKGLYRTGILLNHYNYMRRNSNVLGTTTKFPLVNCMKNNIWFVIEGIVGGGLIIGLFPVSVAVIIKRYGSIQNFLKSIWKS